MLPKLMKKADGDTLDKDVAPDFDWGTEELSAAKKSKDHTSREKDKDEGPTPGRVMRNQEFAGPGKGDAAEKPARSAPDDGRMPAEPPPENDPEVLPEPTTRAPSCATGSPVAKVSFQVPTSAFPTTLQVHEVKRSDNLWKLAETYGVPRKSIVPVWTQPTEASSSLVV